MSKRLIIIGAGGFGRGVYSWLVQSPRHLENSNIQDIVFVDDADPIVKPRARIIDTVLSFNPAPGDEIMVAIADPEQRENVVAGLQGRGTSYHTFVDDRAIVAQGVEIGEGSIVCPGVVIDADVTIGAHVHINFNSTVGHDTTIGDFTTLSPLTNVMGEVSVGHGVFLGGGSVILPRINIGDRAVIGAGTTVVSSVFPRSTVVGNPAKPIKKPSLGSSGQLH